MVDYVLGPLERALRDAVEAAVWLEASDGAVVELAAMYARRMDQGWVEFQSGDLTSTDYNKVLYLGPHLLNTLKSIGLSPEDRQNILAARPVEREVDLVDDLRNKRRARVVGGS